MQIQLKQAEIVAALRQYITQQGINLTSKNVKITFTAGRKESGISADIVIEEGDYFDLGNVEAEAPEAGDAPKPSKGILRAVAMEKEETISSAVQEPEAAPAVEEPVVKTASLFS